jgi:phage host-nuclease inhibitor protein Gam
MKLTQIALDKIRNPRIRVRLAMALGVTDQSIMNYIKDNRDELTKAAALKVIREETGLVDSQILTEEEIRA